MEQVSSRENPASFSAGGRMTACSMRSAVQDRGIWPDLPIEAGGNRPGREKQTLQCLCFFPAERRRPSRPRWRSYNAYNPDVRRNSRKSAEFYGPVDDISQKRRVYLIGSRKEIVRPSVASTLECKTMPDSPRAETVG